jgi:ribonuclease T
MASEIDNSKNNILQMNQRFGSYLPVIVDIETGGVVCETDAILELSASYLRLDKHGILHASEPDTYHVLPFKGANLNPKAMAIHGIDPYHPFRFAKEEGEILEAFYAVVWEKVKAAGCRRATLVGHNAHFDLNFLNAANKREKIKDSPFHAFTCLDTATLGAVFYGKTVLASALQVAGIPYNKDEAHAASYDVDVTAKLFCKIINEHPKFCVET